MTGRGHVGLSAPDEVETDQSLAAGEFAGPVRHSTDAGRADLTALLHRTLTALRACHPPGP